MLKKRAKTFGLKNNHSEEKSGFSGKKVENSRT